MRGLEAFPEMKCWYFTAKLGLTVKYARPSRAYRAQTHYLSVFSKA